MPDPTPDAIREAFERWCRDEFGWDDNELRRTRYGVYAKVLTTRCWTVWHGCAAWATANKEQRR